nr:ABC transporter permease subunit [Vicinamibacterales bacterium]
ADAIAGERERHTLETLLASRLPDPAILLGKVLAAVSYGWGLVMGMLLLSLVTVNMSARSDGLLLFPARIAVGAPLLALLGAGLAAAAGVLVSLRAATVRHAAQALSVGILLLIFVPVFLAESMPDAWKARAASWLMTAGADRIAWSAAAGLAGLDLALMGLALARFRRVRLIVD